MTCGVRSELLRGPYQWRYGIGKRNTIAVPKKSGGVLWERWVLWRSVRFYLRLCFQKYGGNVWSLTDRCRGGGVKYGYE